MRLRGIRGLAILALIALAACTPESARRFDSTAGAGMDGGPIGKAVQGNRRAMISQRDMAIDLTRRFARAVPARITFAFDSARPGPRAREALAAQAGWMRRHPEIRFRVYGHTDKVGPPAYNKRLGLRRAQAAVRYLVRRGVARDRLEGVASFGETRPLVMTPGPERRNRRTVTEVSGVVKGARLIFDGKYMRTAYGGYLDSAAAPQKLDASVDE